MRRTVSLVVEVHICPTRSYTQDTNTHLGVLASLSNLDTCTISPDTVPRTGRFAPELKYQH
jgi:hypothetical protein